MKKKEIITIDGATMNVLLDGSLDTTKATNLIVEFDKFAEEEVDKIVFDATTLTFIASTGIRAVLYAGKLFDNNPGIEMVGANADVRKVFDMTGISSYITFK